MRAVLLGQEGLAEALKRDGARVAGPLAENHERLRADVGVLREAAGLVARRRFARDTDVRVISAYVYEVRQAADGLPVLAAEAVIRSALGEEIDTSDVSLGEMHLACTVILARLCADMYRDPVSGVVDEVELDRILVEAERGAKARGFEPLLVSAIMQPSVGEDG